LTDVNFLASAGISALIPSANSAGEETTFAVVAHGASTARPMKLVGVDRSFAIYSSLDDALAGLPAPVVPQTRKT
jgi:anti-anti-sigma regulatory factor